MDNNQGQPTAAELSSQVHGLNTLWQLSTEARAAENLNELSYIIANETQRLVKYKQSALWVKENGRLGKILAVSSVSKVEKNAQYIIWLRKVAKYFYKNGAKDLRAIAKEELPEKLQNDELAFPHIAWVPLLDSNNNFVAGTICLKYEPWNEGELSLLKLINDSYAHSFSALSKKKTITNSINLFRKRIVFLFVLAVLIFSLFIPISMTALAPAEIIPIAPKIITSPYSGVIDKFLVLQNSEVSKDDILFNLDDTDLKNRAAVAYEEYQIFSESLARASKQAFVDNEAKAKIIQLGLERDQKFIEWEHAKELLDKVQIKSPTNGLAIFTDPNEWRGKPVQVGEKVMLIANPNKVEIKVNLEVNNTIIFEKDAKVLFFLNIDPLNPIDAKVRAISYEATQTPEKNLAYNIKATLLIDKDKPLPRIGLKGTAKIYGQKVTVFYYLFRRPISWIRQKTGF